MDTIGKRIRAGREACGYQSAADLAKAAGTHRVNVLRWEAGTVTPGGAALMKLANALGCSVDWLLTGKGDPPNHGGC
jgi:transcriptional regulator with XRE-family HTH domain